jgi:hypothetical protein
MPAGFERILGKRAILSALGPLAGVRATGDVTATASGADVVLPPFTYGVPIIGGQAVYARMVKTLPTNAITEEPEGTTVTSSGTAVAVRAVCGGPSGNLLAGTPIIWQPLPSGIVARGEVAAGGITGGVASSGAGSCARVVAFEGLGADAARALWEAQGEGFPAVVVSRMGSRPSQWSTARSQRRAHGFQIGVFSAHYAGNDERSEEGEHLLDEIGKILEGLEDVDGEIFSGPGCELGVEQRIQRSPNAHVWMIEATIHYGIPATDARLTDGVSWQAWETTQIQSAEPATDTQDPVVLADTTHEQEQ